METVLKKREKSRPSIPIRIEAVFDEKEDILAFMYKTYADNLYAYGLSFHSDIAMIEDAIHDVFIDIYTNEKGLAHISNLRQYLIAAFRHRLLFLLQDKKRYARILNDTFDSFVEKMMTLPIFGKRISIMLNSNCLISLRIKEKYASLRKKAKLRSMEKRRR